MRERPNRHLYTSDDCNCCIISCIPCIYSSFALEQLLKCICCCPCYYNQVTPIQNNKIVIPQLNDDIKNRYTGKIWGILR